MKLDFSMAKAGDKYIGEMEFQKKGGDFDVWTVIKRGRIFLIGTATNTGLLSDYYYKMEAGESEQNALLEINDDLEVLATDGASYMSRVTKIPRKISANRRRKLRGNPYITKGGKKVLYGYAKQNMSLLGTGLKISKGDLVLLTPATNLPDGGYYARPGYPTGIWKQVSEDDSIYIPASDLYDDITFKKTAFGSKEFMRQMRGNPNRQKAPRYSKTLPNKFYKIYWSHHARGDTAGLVFKGDKIMKISMSELSRFWPTNEGLKMERLHVLGPFDSWDQAFAAPR